MKINNWNLKIRVEGINSRLGHAEEWMNNLEDRVVETNKLKTKKQNKTKTREREIFPLNRYETFSDINTLGHKSQ